MSGSRSLKFSHIFARLFLVIGVGLCVVLLTLHFRAKHHYEMGVKNLTDSGDWKISSDEFEMSAKAYFPGGIYHKKSLNRISLMAKGAMVRGQFEKANHLWTVVGRSVLSTRHFVQPNKEYFDESVKQLKILENRDSSDKIDIDNCARIESPEDPSPYLSFIMFTGLLVWIFGALFSIIFDKKGGRLLSFGISFIGLTVWIFMAAII